MADIVESLNSNPDPHDHAPPSTTTAETNQSGPESSEAWNTATSAASEKRPNVSFSIWPPTDRTRQAVKNRLIETLSEPSILSKRYGTISREEAVDAAKVIEEEAFEVAGKAATADGDGIEVLQVYSKDISKRMLEKVKARSGESVSAPATAQVDEAPPVKTEEDAGTLAPPQSAKAESVSGDE